MSNDIFKDTKTMVSKLIKITSHNQTIANIINKAHALLCSSKMNLVDNNMFAAHLIYMVNN